MARGRKRESTTRTTASSQPAPAISYRNRMRATYYLHEGQTKTGRVRYFAAKTVGEGALSAMPDGYKFTESINGVVSVSKVNTAAPAISEADLEVVGAELARHQHLGFHQVEVVKREIVVFEPSHRKYAPVMKFVPAERAGEYAVHRMTYRGDGGWSWPLAVGPLTKLVKRYLGKIGTEAFFELI
jgi:hypothetical protein